MYRILLSVAFGAAICVCDCLAEVPWVWNEDWKTCSVDRYTSPLYDSPKNVINAHFWSIDGWGGSPASLVTAYREHMSQGPDKLERGEYETSQEFARRQERTKAAWLGESLELGRTRRVSVQLDAKLAYDADSEVFDLLILPYCGVGGGQDIGIVREFEPFRAYEHFDYDSGYKMNGLQSVGNYQIAFFQLGGPRPVWPQQVEMWEDLNGEGVKTKIPFREHGIFDSTAEFYFLTREASRSYPGLLYDTQLRCAFECPVELAREFKASQQTLRFRIEGELDIFTEEEFKSVRLHAKIWDICFFLVQKVELVDVRTGAVVLGGAVTYVQ